MKIGLLNYLRQQDRTSTMDRVEIDRLSDFDARFGGLGIHVGPRTGPKKRSQDAKEWFVLRRFMAAALPIAIFDLPITITKVHPPEPDFAITHGLAHVPALIEITEATHPDDQREMTEFLKSGEALMLLGDFGGRFADGASQPKLAWASDIHDAIVRKHDKSICRLSTHDRHLLVYPNSNASQLIFDEADERKAFAHLRQRIDADASQYAKMLNGCRVHVLGKALAGFDMTGEFILTPRAARLPTQSPL
ncbi:hypothetical protein [Bradyrhizobium diazoefficiens]|uniref:hypothetical protein n=1 Tax=Bradyrhizobium diazoefficiens TaxID=1355477 RepID=UPI0005395D9B|nr:hypothetical protein [Bradyrhizobium diazoefficiens]MBR0868092.1 hypothetical protein [Bradyrhizobium diazoefficiens]MBR0892614.1 hypothetical protein [Bradyrhizobium diazoefficiens]MBR0924318.1 hypothetical protein [Bradyrhizobium diazoefficiens]BAP82089.1 syntaxin-like protein [Bradyrhizobium diazoefficiens]